MKKSIWLVFTAILFIIACGDGDKFLRVKTLAGTGVMGSINGKATEASFSYMMGLAIDESGNVYVADSHNNLIRKISADGIVTTLAGTGSAGFADGDSAQASFFNPAGVAVDKNGNIYVADTHNSLIRKISPGGQVTTIAGIRPDKTKYGSSESVQFDNPAGIAVDTSGNIYIADWAKDMIRKISPAGKITDIAGNGNPGSTDGKDTSASFYLPGGIAVDLNGNVYVSDTYNNMIRKISPDGSVKTIAGKKKKGSADGKDTAASFSHPAGIAVDNNGNLYVADVDNNKIRKISPDGVVSTFAGTGIRGSTNGPVTTACFYRPYGVAVDQHGNVYVADYQNNLIRKISE
jgi:sugar lactone lactonase YvrE